VSDVDSLHVEIDNLNDPLVGFCFIRSIDIYQQAVQSFDRNVQKENKIQLD
jgi:hypothetical protein